MSHTNKQVLEQANAAISRGDHEGFLALCTDDTRWVFVGDRTLQGKDAVRRWMKESYLRPPQFKVDRMVAEGDTLAAIGEITLFDEAGAPSVHAYCDVWRLRDGKLAELQAFVVQQG